MAVSRFASWFSPAAGNAGRWAATNFYPWRIMINNMDDGLYLQVYNNLNLKETDELVKIWQTNDRIEWTETAFNAIREILNERLGEIPPQNMPIYTHTERSILTKKLDIQSMKKRMALMLFTFSPVFLMLAIIYFYNGPVSSLTWSLLFFLAGFSGVIIVVRKEIPMSFYSIQGKRAVVEGTLFTIFLWSLALYLLVEYL
jgi:hypothetical protein